MQASGRRFDPVWLHQAKQRDPLPRQGVFLSGCFRDLVDDALTGASSCRARPRRPGSCPRADRRWSSAGSGCRRAPRRRKGSAGEQDPLPRAQHRPGPSCLFAGSVLNQVRPAPSLIRWFRYRPVVRAPCPPGALRAIRSVTSMPCAPVSDGHEAGFADRGLITYGLFGSIQ